MCFSSKPKQAKVSPESIAAPTPVAEEAPKGVEFGDDSNSDNSETTNGIKDLKVKKSETGEGTQSAVASDTGRSTTKKTASASIKRALKR